MSFERLVRTHHVIPEQGTREYLERVVTINKE